ncbi:hypothetical protein HYE46_04135 [Mycoplasmopsis bovis]|nr:hypothetical protein [Mycoplasmopsis bovis]WMX75915.1 hypothetical protein HYE46_04135 [Mycoplasmopsis bovis]
MQIVLLIFLKKENLNMKRSIAKIPLLGKLVLKTGIFITPPPSYFS